VIYNTQSTRNVQSDKNEKRREIENSILNLL